MKVQWESCLAITLTVLCFWYAPIQAFWGKTDYTDMDQAQAEETIRKLDSQIKSVKIIPLNGKELPVITFREEL